MECEKNHGCLLIYFYARLRFSHFRVLSASGSNFTDYNLLFAGISLKRILFDRPRSDEQGCKVTPTRGNL